MATLHAYVDKKGYYVRHSFATGGKLFHVNYQTTEVAVRRFTTQGLRDGDLIPNGLLHELINTGDLFTGKTGTNSIELDPKEAKDCAGTEISLSSLSVEARKWFGLMLSCHPSCSVDLRTFSKTDDGMSVEFIGLPDNYVEQLLFIARRFDGTSLFENLRLSFRSLPPNATFQASGGSIGSKST